MINGILEIIDMLTCDNQHTFLDDETNDVIVETFDQLCTFVYKFTKYLL